MERTITDLENTLRWSIHNLISSPHDLAHISVKSIGPRQVEVAIECTCWNGSIVKVDCKLELLPHGVEVLSGYSFQYYEWDGQTIVRYDDAHGYSHKHVAAKPYSCPTPTIEQFLKEVALILAGGKPLIP